MPRQARVRSITGIYHIMLRGIDKRDVFLDNEDKLKFLESIEKAKEKGKFKVLGYCLMDNHIHMLLKEDEEIGTSIKRITVETQGRFGCLPYLSIRIDFAMINVIIISN